MGRQSLFPDPSSRFILLSFVSCFCFILSLLLFCFIFIMMGISALGASPCIQDFALMRFLDRLHTIAQLMSNSQTCKGVFQNKNPDLAAIQNGRFFSLCDNFFILISIFSPLFFSRKGRNPHRFLRGVVLVEGRILF